MAKSLTGWRPTPESRNEQLYALALVRLPSPWARTLATLHHSCRQGTPESSDRDVNPNRPTDLIQASIALIGALQGGLNAGLRVANLRLKPN